MKDGTWGCLIVGAAFLIPVAGIFGSLASITLAKRVTATETFTAQLKGDVDLYEKRLAELEKSLPPKLPHVQMKTTYYGKDFHGKKMANGKLFDMRKKTVAHRTLPLGTPLLLEYQGRHALGTVTDRGPAEWTGNELDVSEHLAHVLRMHRVGVASVRVTRLN